MPRGFFHFEVHRLHLKMVLGFLPFCRKKKKYHFHLISLRITPNLFHLPLPKVIYMLLINISIYCEKIIYIPLEAVDLGSFYINAFLRDPV